MRAIFFIFLFIHLVSKDVQAKVFFFPLDQLQDSTIISIHKPKNQSDIFMYCLVPFGKTIQYEPRQKEIDTLVLTGKYPIRLITTDENKKYKQGRHLSFIIYPGDKLFASKNNDGETYIRSLTDSIRTNELAFFNEFEKECGEFEGYMVGLIPINMSENERYKLLTGNYQKRVAFLEKYKSNRTIREEYYNYLKNLFLSNYLVSISYLYYSPYAQKRIQENTEIKKVFQSNINIDDRFFFESFYRAAILNYVISKSEQKLTTPEIDYNMVFESALKNLSGTTLEVTLLDIINNNKQSIDKSLNLKIVEKLAEIVKNPTINAYVNDDLLPFYKKTTSSESIENDMPILNTDYDVKEFNTVFKQAGAKFFYVDFWASWCAPCRAEMPYSKKLKEEYAKKGVGFIYISTDQDPNAWKTATKELNLKPENSYLLPNGNESAIAQKFKISLIPRYMLIDTNGNIISDEAIRPSDLSIRQVFDKLLKKYEQ